MQNTPTAPYKKHHPNYTLQAHLPTPSTLQITLTTKKPPYNTYSKTYILQSLPPYLSLMEISLEELLEFVRSDCRVDQERGRIGVAPPFVLNGRARRKEVELELDWVGVDRVEEEEENEEEQARQWQEEDRVFILPDSEFSDCHFGIASSMDEEATFKIQIQPNQQPTQQSLEPQFKTNIDRIETLLRNIEEEKSQFISRVEKVKRNGYESGESEPMSMELEEGELEEGELEEGELLENQYSKEEEQELEDMEFKMQSSKYAKKSSKSNPAPIPLYQKNPLPANKSPYSSFTHSLNIFTYSNPNYRHNQLVFHHLMRYKSRINSFKLRVVSVEKEMAIGVVCRGTAKSSYTRAAVFYCADGGIVSGRDFRDRQGSGFASGDVIEVVLYHGSISWQVNRQPPIYLDSQKFTKQKIQFLPIVELYTRGDAVEWIP